jgi:hypothetical protein
MKNKPQPSKPLESVDSKQLVFMLKKLTEAIEKNNLLREKELKLEEKKFLLERKSNGKDAQV